MQRPPVEPTRRGAISNARKRRLWEAHGGLCRECRLPVPMFGPTVRYDHFIPLELGGPDTDDNIGPLHREPCDVLKCARDARDIAKARRLRKKADRATRKAPTMKSRGFDKSRSRGFDGKVRRRT